MSTNKKITYVNYQIQTLFIQPNIALLGPGTETRARGCYFKAVRVLLQKSRWSRVILLYDYYYARNYYTCLN